jgi:CheY-like chemotaxis protein
MSLTPPQVVLVEDNEDDVFLLRRALQKAQLEVSLHLLQDGQEALDYFERLAAQPATKASLPDLVLLDLKLPFVPGFDVLTFIRNQPQLRDLNVIVLTSSAELRDQERATELNAHGYFVKPPHPDMLTEVARVLSASA